MVVAYLRVSTDKQHLENQKDEINRFCRQKGLSVDRWHCEVVSGKKRGRERKLTSVLNKLSEGDVLIVTEVSRLSRTLLEIMNILNTCLLKKVVLYSTKDGYAFENNINSKVLGFAFGLVAEIEHNLISIRTKEALSRRRSEGMVLGRPKGSRTQLNKLFDNREEVLELLGRGCTHLGIAERYGVSLRTFYRFLKAVRGEECDNVSFLPRDLSGKARLGGNPD